MNSIRDLSETLRASGIGAGSVVLVHSSYRSLSPFENGPRGVVEALLDVVGPDGTLAMPAFNYTSPPPTPWFDPAVTPGRTGAIGETLRLWPGAERSLHPTHSLVARGPRADEILRDHRAARAFGAGSPLHRLAEQPAWVVLLGVGMVSCSLIHVAEELAGIPKPPKGNPPPVVRLRLPDGAIAEHVLDPSPSCSAGFEAAAGILRAEGVIRDTRLGACLIQVMRSDRVLGALVPRLQANPLALICTNPECPCCRGVEAAVRGDVV